jgi:hypothetical protein
VRLRLISAGDRSDGLKRESSNLLPTTKICTDGRVAQCKSLQNSKTVSSNLTLCSSCKKTTVQNVVDKVMEKSIIVSVVSSNDL